MLAQQTGALTRQQQFPDIFSYFCPTCLNIISILIFGTLPLQLIISQTSIYDHYFYSADEKEHKVKIKVKSTFSIEKKVIVFLSVQKYKLKIIQK